MRTRLLVSMLLVAILALAGFGVPLALSVRARQLDESLLILSEEAARAAVEVPGSFAAEDDLPELPDPRAEVTTALYGLDGRRIVGDGPEDGDATVQRALRTATVQADADGLVVSLPVSHEEEVVGAIRAHMDPTIVADRIRRTWLSMTALAAAVLAAAGALAVVRSRHLAGPMARLRDAAEVLGGGGQVARGPATGIDEIDSIDDALHTAAERVRDATFRERAFSSDVAHQMRTPIASLRLRLETEQQLRTERDDLIESSLVDLDRVEATISDLLALARDVPTVGEPHPLATVIRDAEHRWRPVVEADRRRFEVTIGAQLPFVSVSAAAVGQILDILLDNARIHGSGRIVLTARRVGGGATIAIGDEGTATVDPTAAFERRTGSTRSTGIGLALGRRLAEAEGMRLVLADPGPGPTFHLIVPAARS